jgi:hypothetical protein
MTQATASTNSTQTQQTNTSLSDMTRIFNTALIATKAEAARDFSSELYTLVESPGFSSIVEAIRTLARTQNINEREAAETIIRTFRKLDQLWSEYVFQEGVDRLKRQPH